MLGYGHPMQLEPNMKTSRQTSQQLLGNIWQSLREKDIKEAINTSNLLVQKYPDFAEGWHAASHVAQAVRRPGPALIAIERALSLEPANIDWQLHRASCLLVCGNNENSTRLLHKMVATCDSFSAKQLSQLAFLCSRIECHDEASQIYLKLITLEPDNGGNWYNLASMQRFQGRIEQAMESLDRAILLNGKDYEAYLLRSDLCKQTSASNHIAQLQGLLDDGIDVPAGEVQICFALAKELEDIGNSQESFETLSRGATLRRKHINYHVEDDLKTIAAIMESFGTAMFANPSKGLSTREPVFVIGLPRTGTTLVERILGNHPEVFAAGELNNFAVQLMQQVRQQSGAQELSRKELVQQTANLDYNKLGQTYLESTRPLTGHTTHFVDKMPLNFLYAGLIHRAMPNAKIIHLSRHPMDTCYSNYKCLFQDAYPWSYDLGEIALYYSAYHQLMTHWNSVMPGVIHELAYEDLVGDVEGQARKLLDFCDLTWDSQCVLFHESRATSTTASATQVRQPVYQSSVNRWKSYREQLSPLREQLGNLGIDVD